MMKVQAVPLSTQPSERLVKRGALLLFRGIHAIAAQAAKAPGALAQASADIKSAWQEAASDPKA
jgi:hypothetical protein